MPLFNYEADNERGIIIKEGEILKKKLWISVLILGITIAGLYYFVKFNPPLVIGALGLSEDYKSVIVEVGNKGFREVKILDVVVNNNEKPSKTKVQVSNAIQGFIITDNFNNNESKKYGFTNIEDTTIKVDTSPKTQLEKLDNGTATSNDEIYGISVIHNESIIKVDIRYSYLGITFNKTVPINIQ